MNVSGERILIFGDSLSHHGADNDPEIWPVDQGSNRVTSAPGDLLASLLLEAGAQAVLVDANVGRSAINFWSGGASHQFNTSDDLIATDQQFVPTKVIVFLGTNDLGMDPTQDGTGFTMIKNSFPNAQIIAIGPPIFADDRLNTQAETVYATLRDVFGSGNVIDARPLSSTSGRAGDGIHFGASAASDFAYQLLAQVKSAGGLAMWQVIGLGVLGIGMFIGVGAYMHKREARHAQMHGLSEGSEETADEEPEQEDPEHDENERESDDEIRAAVHWYSKKYGITPLEARKLITSPRREQLEHEIELWRAKQGYPAPNSALVRGHVRDQIKSLGWGFAAPTIDVEMAQKSVDEENQAIADYGKRAHEAKDPELQEIFEHNRKDEAHHADKLYKWGEKHGGLTGETPVAMVRFASPDARRQFQDKLRERMYAAGYEPHQVTEWMRHRFDSKKLVAHISGSDDIDRAADVANEVRGVMVKRQSGLGNALPNDFIKKWARKKRTYLKLIDQLSAGDDDIEPARRALDRLRKMIDEAAGHAPESYRDPLVTELNNEFDALPKIGEAAERGRAARVEHYSAESKRLKEEEREARAHLPSDYHPGKLSGLEAAKRQPEYETNTSEDGPGMRPPWTADVGVGRRNNASPLYWKRVVAEYKKEADLRERGSDAALKIDLKVGHAPDAHTPYTYVDWPDPMDTKGAIAFAKKLIDDGGAKYSDVRARVFRQTAKRDAGDRGVTYTLAKFEDEHA